MSHLSPSSVSGPLPALYRKTFRRATNSVRTATQTRRSAREPTDEVPKESKVGPIPFAILFPVLINPYNYRRFMYPYTPICQRLQRVLAHFHNLYIFGPVGVIRVQIAETVDV
ncbi:hypothetical protein K443DRAFT_9692 [Laccaria amethystina LaAM-08-1]|uniref:Uncharacterized protein n=1 Tax=Laccaria amethystina LaAM-08-1 TaxID=1095629 RepID=A0A0C9XJH5_9AGAR|nr:hypothetical protein K443DRAFT_9692 [Laccaria amethystina LaAM-08-1]